jgi:O-antigen/teichoic acid export membrane protein
VKLPTGARGGGRAALTGALRRLREPLYANAAYLFGVTAVSSLTGFFFLGIAARLYDPEAVGLATAGISAVALVAGIANLGLGNGLVRYLPEARSPVRLLNTVFTLASGR